MSSDIIDPIELLRDYITQSQIDLNNGIPLDKQARKITLDSGMLLFHQFEGIGSGAIIRLPLETPTAWKKN